MFVRSWRIPIRSSPTRCPSAVCEARRRSRRLANAHGFESVHWEGVHCGNAPVDQACTSDNVGLNIKDLDKNNMSRSEDVMVDKKDRTLGRTKEFNAITGVGHPKRDQGRFLNHWIRVRRMYSIPHFSPEVDDEKGNWR